MENLCHTLTGWVIARAGVKRLSPGATATCMVGANLPDIDIVTLWQGNLFYLEHHRGITHAVLGLAAQSFILAASALGAHRIWARIRGETEKANFVGLLAAASAGLASHFALDWTNSYGVRPWLPFDRTWYYGDIVFVVDPWLWLLLGGALFLGAARTRAANAAWILLFLVLATIVTLAGIFVASAEIGAAVWIWFLGLAALLVLRFRKEDWNGAQMARAALAVYVFYAASLGLAHASAIDAAGRLPAESGISTTEAAEMAVNPLPMRPDRWRLFLKTPDKIVTAKYDLSGSFSEIAVRERNLDTPEAVAALGTCPGRVASHFGRFLRAETESGAASVRVDFFDERFPPREGSRPVGQISVLLDTNLKPLPDSRPCPY